MSLSITRPFEVDPSRRGLAALRYFILRTSADGVELIPVCGRGSGSLAAVFGVAQNIARDQPVTLIDMEGHASAVERITRATDADRAPARDDEWHVSVSVGPKPWHAIAVANAAAQGVTLSADSEMVTELDGPGRAYFYGCHHLND